MFRKADEIKRNNIHKHSKLKNLIVAVKSTNILKKKSNQNNNSKYQNVPSEKSKSNLLSASNSYTNLMAASKARTKSSKNIKIPSLKGIPETQKKMKKKRSGDHFHNNSGIIIPMRGTRRSKMFNSQKDFKINKKNLTSQKKSRNGNQGNNISEIFNQNYEVTLPDAQNDRKPKNEIKDFMPFMKLQNNQVSPLKPQTIGDLIAQARTKASSLPKIRLKVSPAEEASKKSIKLNNSKSSKKGFNRRMIGRHHRNSLSGFDKLHSVPKHLAGHKEALRRTSFFHPGYLDEVDHHADLEGDNEVSESQSQKDEGLKVFFRSVGVFIKESMLKNRKVLLDKKHCILANKELMNMANDLQEELDEQKSILNDLSKKHKKFNQKKTVKAFKDRILAKKKFLMWKDPRAKSRKVKMDVNMEILKKTPEEVQRSVNDLVDYFKEKTQKRKEARKQIQLAMSRGKSRQSKRRRRKRKKKD